MPPLRPCGPGGDAETIDCLLVGLRMHFTFALRRGLLLRKEVIQPLVPQRLPCYDFIPITTHTLDGFHRLRVQTAFMM